MPRVPPRRRSGSARRLLPRAPACPAAASTAPPRGCASSPNHSRDGGTATGRKRWRRWHGRTRGRTCLPPRSLLRRQGAVRRYRGPRPERHLQPRRSDARGSRIGGAALRRPLQRWWKTDRRVTLRSERFKVPEEDRPRAARLERMVAISRWRLPAGRVSRLLRLPKAVRSPRARGRSLPRCGAWRPRGAGPRTARPRARRAPRRSVVG